MRTKQIGVRHRQAREAIVDLTKSRGYAPSSEEVAAHIGVSRTHLRRLLDDLADAGDVTWEPGQARTLRVTPRETST